jgi:tetratricopeptide (TPR) repeat protein
MDPYRGADYFGRGSIYMIEKDYSRAIDDFNRAIEYGFKSSFAYAMRSGVYLAQQNYEQAISDSNKAIERDINNPIAYGGRGIAYFRSGKYQQALDDFNMTIEKIKLKQIPGGLSESYAKILAGAYAWRGDTFSKLGDNEKSITEYKTAAQLGHQNAQNLLRKKGIDW